MALSYVVLVVLGAASVALARDCTSQSATGLCMARIPRYFYNVNSGQCEHFIYGGCGGNENNYKTLDECQKSCGRLSLDDCSAKPETGLCEALIRRHYFDVASGTCKEFTYGGCGGNRNNFRDESECEDRCGQYKKEPELTLEECSAEPESGMCMAYFRSYAFNPKTGKCEFFVYGGCGGNTNRFDSEEHCVNQCGKYATVQPHESEMTLEECSAEPETGMCRAYVPSYAFNPKTGKCEFFVYGGCDGNSNRFSSEEHCASQCGKYAPVQAIAPVESEMTLEECSAEPETGMCRAYFPSYAFNPKSGKCEFFVYGGCGGNTNRFVSEEHCASQCGKFAVAQASAPVESEMTLEECSAEPETGMCRAYIPSYAFNPKSGKCEFFVYGGCGGNTNRFYSEEHCASQCGKFAPVQASAPVESEMTLEECSAEPETGVCRAYIPSYAFNPKTGKCEFFVYGGCGGNTNRFYSEEHCTSQCGKFAVARAPVAVPDCTAQAESGVCLAYIPSYFYNIKSGKCEKFIYGGCGGNGNRFETEDDCKETCVQAIPVVDERLAVGVCGQAKEVGMCKAAFPRYYYDVSTGSCQKFTYGGCGGNGNNFANLEDCHNTCIA